MPGKTKHRKGRRRENPQKLGREKMSKKEREKKNNQVQLNFPVQGKQQRPEKN